MQLRQPTRRAPIQAFAMLVVCLLAPASAWSQIYKWVNENGGIVYSNIRPEDTGKLRNFEVAIKEEKPSPAAAAAAQQAAQSAEAAARAASLAQQAAQAAQEASAASVAQQTAQAAREDALRRDQALQDRIAYLEREVQAQQYAPPPAPPPDPGYYADSSYYGTALPGYVYPWGYAITYVLPSRIISPRFGIAPRFGIPPRFHGRRVGESLFGPPRLGSPVHLPPMFGSIHRGSIGRGR